MSVSGDGVKMEGFKKEVEVAGKNFIIESGKVAKQAGGSCTVTVGETIVLVTVVASKDPKLGINFMPLTVDYRERTYAAGRIPGGLFHPLKNLCLPLLLSFQIPAVFIHTNFIWSHSVFMCSV